MHAIDRNQPSRLPVLLPPTDRAIKRETGMRIGDVALPALASGLTFSASAIVAQRAAAPLVDWVSGIAVGPPEVVSAGVAAAGVVAFASYGVHFLRTAFRAASGFLRRSGDETATGRTASRTTADDLEHLMLSTFAIAPTVSLALANHSDVVFPGAAIIVAVAAAKACHDIAKSENAAAFAERDALAKSAKKEAA